MKSTNYQYVAIKPSYIFYFDGKRCDGYSDKNIHIVSVNNLFNFTRIGHTFEECWNFLSGKIHMTYKYELRKNRQRKRRIVIYDNKDKAIVWKEEDKVNHTFRLDYRTYIVPDSKVSFEDLKGNNALSASHYLAERIGIENFAKYFYQTT